MVFNQQQGSRECMSGLVGLVQAFCVEHMRADSSARNQCLCLRTFSSVDSAVVFLKVCSISVER